MARPQGEDANGEQPRICAQAVLTEAQIMAGTAQPAAKPTPIAEDALRTYLAENSKTVRAVEGYSEIAAALERLSDEAHTDLEALEQRLTVLEEKMVAIARTRQSDEDLLTVRREMGLPIAPLSRQDDRRPVIHAGKAIPGARPAGKGRAAAAEPVLHAVRAGNYSVGGAHGERYRVACHLIGTNAAEIKASRRV